MFKIFEKEIIWGGKRLSLQTGKLARQADGAVVVTYGDTVVLCTVVAARDPHVGIDFLPLSVHYQEKSFAVGKIPGGFMKREGKPSEREVLISRLIDRPLRPLFSHGFFHETQVVCTVLSHDMGQESDIPALIGASAALALSGLPFLGPVAAARVGICEGEFVLNPGKEVLETSPLDLVVAGPSEGYVMVESEAQQLSEDTMAAALAFGQEAYAPVIKLISDLAEVASKKPWQLPESGLTSLLKARVEAIASTEIAEAYCISDKVERQKVISDIRSRVNQELDPEEFAPHFQKLALKDLERNIVRQRILNHGVRIDGRGSSDIRPIVCEVGVLPCAHGSALFTRGSTQALVATTLGATDDAQRVDGLGGEYKQAFMLHYNFPSFSVGEVGRMMGPGRREIGHGKLAWRGINPLLSKDFPYALRVVSEVLESDGSSSMATLCGSSLALMDAGVPLKAPAAGIAMGLITAEDNRFVVLSDILGDEDNLGDMDFKVAGTSQGITALQMDSKIPCIRDTILKQALEEARQGRLHILSEMAKAISTSRKEIHENAPRIEYITISKAKIKDLIGPGGKVIREICETTSAKIDIQDTGLVSVFAAQGKSLQAALDRIRQLTREPQVGDVFNGKVVKIIEHGAFINFSGPKDGFVHISELAERHVAKVTDVVAEGSSVRVKIIGVDDKGRIKLSVKQASDNRPEVHCAPAG